MLMCLVLQENYEAVILVGIEDLNTLLTQLRDVSYQWEFIGLALHLLQPQLNKLAEDNRGRSQDRHLSAVLQKWLQQCYDTKKFDKPSWRMLLKALEGVEDCKTTVDRIKKKKPWTK